MEVEGEGEEMELEEATENQKREIDFKKVQENSKWFDKDIFNILND
jgi:hypothetical protein